MSNYVFVIDIDKRPLDPVHPGKARVLLNQGKAAVFRRYPFTLILKQQVAEPVRPLRLKIDPGSKTTGLALLQDDKVIWAAELVHRGQQIKHSLRNRRQLRRARRNRKTRYRKPRFLNRKRLEGWLAPSLQSRVDNILTWVNRLRRLCLITAFSQELVRFDTQAMQNPEIAGVEYQQGELAGYEVREYLLEKWGRQCAYCGVTDTPLEVEHIQPKSKGGSDRVSNLTIACRHCNQVKGNKDIQDFLSGKPDLLKRFLSQAKAPLKDAAAMNSTRWTLFDTLKGIGLPIQAGTGSRTKFNRCSQGLAKTHWLDAACVGALTPQLKLLTTQPLLIRAKGRGTRQRSSVNKYGFPKTYFARAKSFMGFQTGDIVRARIAKGKFAGNFIGRITIRFRPSFLFYPEGRKPFDVNPKYLQTVHKADGYAFSFIGTNSSSN